MKRIILTCIGFGLVITNNAHATNFAGSCNVPAHQLCFTYLQGYTKISASQSCKKLGLAQFSTLGCSSQGRIGTCMNIKDNTLIESNFYSSKWTNQLAKERCAKSNGTFRQ